MQRLTIFGVCALLVFAIFGAGCGSNISAAEIKTALKQNAADNAAYFARLGKDHREVIEAKFISKQTFFKGFTKADYERLNKEAEASKQKVEGETLFNVYAEKAGFFQVDDTEGGVNIAPTQKALSFANNWAKVDKEGTVKFERAIRIVSNVESIGDIWVHDGDGKTANAKATITRHLEPGFTEFETYLSDHFKDQIELGRISLDVDLEKEVDGKWKVVMATRDPGVKATTAATLTDADLKLLVGANTENFRICPTRLTI